MDLDKKLSKMLEEAKKYKTCMSLNVTEHAVELLLDTSVPIYSEWIKGEGADIALFKSQETGKVMGCRLPIYDNKLSVFHQGPIKINNGFLKEEEEDNKIYWIEDAANQIAKIVPDEVNSLQIEDIIMKNYKKYSFIPGQVVLFDPSNFNPDFWNNLPEADRIKYYGSLGYGQNKKKLFVWLSAILDHEGNDTGHCVLVDMDDQHIETMRHTSDFRLATDEEF